MLKKVVLCLKKNALPARIRQMRLQMGMTQKSLAQQLEKSESAVRMWELGKNEPDCSMLTAMSRLFGCSVDYLLGLERSPLVSTDNTDIPLFEGYGLHSRPDQAVGKVPLPLKYRGDGLRYFALTVADDSMSPLLRHGDTVLVREQETCFASQIALVSAGQEKALIRKVLFQNAGILLQPYNPAFHALFISSQSISDLPVNILGVILQIIREL